MKGGGGYHSLLLASVGCGALERGVWGGLRAGDNAVGMSVGAGIVPNYLGVGGKVCSLTINCVAHNL
jgi:hypothetical protein